MQTLVLSSCRVLLLDYASAADKEECRWVVCRQATVIFHITLAVLIERTGMAGALGVRH